VAIDGLSREPDQPDEPERPPAADLARAVGELASENADLYKKVGELTDALKLERARFAAWAKEVSAREEAMNRRFADLEHRLQDKAPGPGPGELPRAVGAGRTSEGQKAEERPRKRLSNEAVGLGASIIGGGLQAAGEMLGTTAAADATGLIGWGVAIGAAAVAWSRGRRKDSDGDRSQG
jgi:hypothetical protein